MEHCRAGCERGAYHLIANDLSGEMQVHGGFVKIYVFIVEVVRIVVWKLCYFPRQLQLEVSICRPAGLKPSRQRRVRLNILDKA